GPLSLQGLRTSRLSDRRHLRRRSRQARDDPRRRAHPPPTRPAERGEGAQPTARHRGGAPAVPPARAANPGPPRHPPPPQLRATKDVRFKSVDLSIELDTLSFYLVQGLRT